MIKSPGIKSLFWRTFLLLCGLIFFSVIGWLQSFRVLSELPYSQGISQHIVSTVNLTKYALVTADPLYRIDLLKTLADREGVIISPRDDNDRVEKLSSEGYNGLIDQLVKNALGPDTVLARRVNGHSGLWVSFDIDGDQYWLQTRDDLLDPPYGTTWLWWALAAAAASLFGATLLTRHVIDPLKRLEKTAEAISQGKEPEPLPENASVSEIQAVNRNFNQMVRALNRMEADRELLLAGVSHDLRTPITRLRLELELSNLPDDTREAMISDLGQMENIVNQFMAYARRSTEAQVLMNLGECVKSVIEGARLDTDPSVDVTMDVDLNTFIEAHPTELSRAIQNLCTNAQRYGRSDDGRLYLNVTVKESDDHRWAILEVADRGQGIPEADRERILRPFERGETARTGVSGSGLGLAIVDRIVRRSGGQIQILDAPEHGMLARVQFPLKAAPNGKRLRKNKQKSADHSAGAVT